MSNYKARYCLFLVLLFSASCGFAQGTLGEYTWEKLGSLPAKEGDSRSLGFAGMYGGAIEDRFILGGGANFPDAPPWEGGEKVYSDQLLVMEKQGGEWVWAKDLDIRLPHPMAYGASLKINDDLILLGGENADGFLDNALVLSWDEGNGEVKIASLPNLPVPLSYLAAANIHQKIYVAGGQNEEVSGKLFMLDLENLQQGWQIQPPPPGSPRALASLVAQHDGVSQKLYLFGGRRKRMENTSELFGDVYAFDPKNSQWELVGTVPDKEGQPSHFSAGSAVASGAGHILLIGGDDGDLFHQLESYGLEAKGEDSLSIIRKRDSLLIQHPGFGRQLRAFHTVTKQWSTLPDLPFDAPVTGLVFAYQGNWVLVSGEIKPGVRTPDIWQLSISRKDSFGWVNFTVLGLYLGALIVMGIMISKKQVSTQDFFKAGGRVPWWAAGISVFGTQLSAITFMAIPAKSFATDWTLFMLMVTIVLVSPIIVFGFLPFFRRLSITSAYEYLELRFNRAMRYLGSLVYVALQLGRLGIVLLLPSLALSVVTGLDVVWCILIMGVLSIFYTVLGGIEAVIWTDVIQVLVLVGGALLSLVWILSHLDMGWEDLRAFIATDAKVKLIDTSFDFTGTSLWVILFGGIATNIAQYGSDQTVVQRYLTTKDEKTAGKSIFTGALMAIPSGLIFFSIGTALYLYYQTYPAALSPVVTNTDGLYPWYIATQLPQGISGILIAAIFAAAMSSLDSSMNSVATVITTDFYHKWFPRDIDGKHTLKFARGITIVVGTIGTGFALMMASMGIPSLWDQFNMLMGLFAGGLGGIFLIGIISTRVNGTGALWGFICSALVQLFVKYQTPLSIHAYALTGLLSAMVLSYLFSLLGPRPSKKQVQGLTLKTLKKI
ncbi:sodium:solute symporter family transporter [Pleomorphovibrio marinus]|uniref:sodium:solute symporter family transporter n=1 Tax=Pleomorphovibrio marinus TaxID=2164132 RepID=UPI000E0CB5F1|nr:sodium/solute symporter [Pleomorphovibrio marinus]